MKSFTLKDKTNKNINIETAKLDIENSRQEDISKRTLFAKHFINDDGTYTMEVSPFPIHYYDTKTKSYEEIDNTLEESNGKFSIKKNKMKLSFNKEISDDAPLFNIEKKGHRFQLFYLGKKEKVGNKVLRKVKGKTKRFTKQISNLTYEEIEPKIDLEYSVQYNRIKENIIIKERQESYEFSFLVNVGTLTVSLKKDDSCIELVDAHQEVQYIIPSPIMFDQNNNSSTDLGYEIEISEDGNLIFTLKADADWINSNERAFPVVIDPQVVITIDDNNITKHFQIKNNVASVAGTKGYIDNSSSSNAYLIAIDVSSLLSTKISYAELIFENGNTMPNSASIQAKYYNINNDEVNSSSFTINTSKESNFTSFTGPTSGKASLIMPGALNKWISEKKQIGALLFRSTGLYAGSYTFYPPTLSIKYTLQISAPSFYINLKNDCITEIVTGADVGLRYAAREKGVLTTYVDQTSSKVYQILNIQDRIYTRRNNNDLDNWNEWEKHSLRAKLQNGNLYLTDED